MSTVLHHAWALEVAQQPGLNAKMLSFFDTVGRRSVADEHRDEIAAYQLDICTGGDTVTI